MKRNFALIMAIVMFLSISLSVTSFASKEVSVKEGIYTIESCLKENMMLDIKGASKSNGANVQLYKNNGSMAQMFWIEKVGSKYKITSVNSGKVLDVQEEKLKSGTNVQQYQYKNINTQKWKFYSAGKNKYYIGCGNFALDVSGGNKNNGANVQIYKPNSTSSQAWKLNKISAPQKVESFRAETGMGDYCIVRIDDSLMNKKGKQTAKIKLSTYKENGKKSTKGEVFVVLRNMHGDFIWSGVKKGGDTIKLDDGNYMYQVYVTKYDKGDGWFANAQDWDNIPITAEFGITTKSGCSLYKK
ncbi:MAG: RICIN domain-containing protein [Clostridia bacterium]|nr:RICIN domain-containing protein [Clostridia bacterium]